MLVMVAGCLRKYKTASLGAGGAVDNNEYNKFMSLNKHRAWLENWQIIIYFAAIILGIIIALSIGTNSFESSINPAIALMLFVTFLQVPISDLLKAFVQYRFLLALLIANFIIIPLFVVLFIQFLPNNFVVKLGVLLTPYIDYVVTFSHLGKADAHLLLAATPVLLIMQLLLLPFYLGLFLEASAAQLVRGGPFVHAFIWLIVIPLSLAVLLQLLSTKSKSVENFLNFLKVLPVPATAALLFLVIVSVVPQLKPAMSSILQVIPIYIAFAIIAPLMGWFVARIFKLDSRGARALAFSSATIGFCYYRFDSNIASNYRYANFY